MLVVAAFVAGASQVLITALLGHGLYHLLVAHFVLVPEVGRILGQRLARLSIPTSLNLPLLYLGKLIRAGSIASH